MLLCFRCWRCIISEVKHSVNEVIHWDPYSKGFNCTAFKYLALTFFFFWSFVSFLCLTFGIYWPAQATLVLSHCLQGAGTHSEFGSLFKYRFLLLTTKSWSCKHFFSFYISAALLWLDRTTQKAKLFSGASLVSREKCSPCRRKLFLFCMSHDSACMRTAKDFQLLRLCWHSG